MTDAITELGAPVVVIGAARSGTNLLRDLLTTFPGHGTWPCDEINYIWRHGNRDHPDDELLPRHAWPDVVDYVRGRFAAIARARRVATVVEKTCANSLRVGFVDQILPECRFVLVVRDPRDVVASAMTRWRARLEPAYLLRKLRYVPPGDAPYYGWRYLRGRLQKLVSSEGRLATWGPRFAGIDEYARRHTLPELCARQWACCIERSEQQLAAIAPTRVHRLRYEALVTRPSTELSSLATFLGVDLPERLRHEASRRVSADSVGRWTSDLDEAALRSVERVCGPLLPRFEGATG